MSAPAESYQSRARRFAGEEARLARRSRALSWARLAAAAAVVLFLFLGLLSAAAPPGWVWLGAAGGGVAFAALALAHDRVIRRQQRWGELAALNEEGLARMARRWDDLPPGPGAADAPEPAAALPAFVRDLDLFGRRSLARLLGTARTPVGRRTVVRWLLAPAPPDEVRRRQAAVAELAPALDFRQRLEAAGLASGVPVDPREASPPAGGAVGRLAGRLGRRSSRREPGDLARFLAWAEGEPWLLRRPVLLWAARLLPVVAFALILAAVAGAVPWSLAALALVVNLVVAWTAAGRIGERLDAVAAGADDLAAYAGALAVAEEGRFAAERLRELAAELEGEPPSGALSRLARRVQIADARHGSFHVITQSLLLWDVHALWLLERWQVGPGRRVRRWLAALGELEALAALAALAHDEPEWTLARIAEDGAPRLTARALAHPLLPGTARVANDVAVGPPGTFLLVTGSNMSGKSTLLRALGVNVVLAQAGGPACAAELELPPLALGTSVIVEDSLGDGVSFFMAELLRLKEVVDLAERAPAEGRTLLFLLDEVLRGTNNRERREALRRVIAHLVARGAIGAVSTHDLELGDLPEIAEAAVPVHFRETVHPPGSEGPPMSFDHLLRPGPATTTNALRLLEAVGLGGGAPRGAPDDEPGPAPH
ncbi:MAG TPA: DNA mismatch repair protein MutS [Thermoanaerobaculia bacterium]